MEKRMERSLIYNGTITAEQFLFYEIRIASKYYLDGTSVEDAIEEIKKNNLFQYPTERLVARMVRSCYKRLDALDDEQLRQELTTAASMAKTSRWRSWNASLISRARRTLSCAADLIDAGGADQHKEYRKAQRKRGSHKTGCDPLCSPHSSPHA